MRTEPASLFEWRDVLVVYVAFVSSFFMLGALGFRFGVLRAIESAAESSMNAQLRAAASAARVGVLGVVLGAISMVADIAKDAAETHVAFARAFRAGGVVAIVELAALVVLFLGFVIAARGTKVGWQLAAVAGAAFALREGLDGGVTALLNPLHLLAASLWLGTLFVLVVCGVGPLLRARPSASEREVLVAQMVNRFSTVALASAALLGITGLVTSYEHLNPFAALWTTPYGYALISKLCVVSIVVSLGAWNWRRVTRALGTDGGARRIYRSAKTELMFAAVVLLLTSILVRLPSPKTAKR
jgi:putative copper export protein